MNVPPEKLSLTAQVQISTACDARLDLGSANYLSLPISTSSFCFLSLRHLSTTLSTIRTIRQDVSKDGRKSKKALKAQSAPPKHDPTKAAAKAAGSTYELVEQILLSLPPKRLFVLQGVNSDWRDIIQRSQRLKKKMFLMPPASAVESPSDAVKFMPFLPISHGSRVTPSIGCRPAISAFVGTGYHCWCHDPELSSMRVDINLKFSTTEEKNESWRKLPLTNPPIKQVCLFIVESAWGNRGRHSKSVHRDDGLTLGDVYQAQEDLVNQVVKEKGVCVSPELVGCRIYVSRRIPTCARAIFEHDYSDGLLKEDGEKCKLYSLFMDTGED